MNRLIIVFGLPGAGKTTLARKLSEKLQIPVISKDDIKIILFETIGFSDEQWSNKLGAASMQLLYYNCEQYMNVGHSVIIESNFRPELDKPRIEKLLAEYGFTAIEFHCFAHPQIIVERSRLRHERGERHPGHVKPAEDDESKATANVQINTALHVGELLEVNTDNFEKINYENIFSKIA